MRGFPWRRAGIAQLVEQRIRNARVVGSNPIPGTTPAGLVSARRPPASLRRFRSKNAMRGVLNLPGNLDVTGARCRPQTKGICSWARTLTISNDPPALSRAGHVDRAGSRAALTASCRAASARARDGRARRIATPPDLDVRRLVAVALVALLAWKLLGSHKAAAHDPGRPRRNPAHHRHRARRCSRSPRA